MVETEHIRLRTDVGRGRAERIAREMQEIRHAFASSVFKCAFQGAGMRLPVTVVSSSLYGDIAPGAATAFYRSMPIGWLPDYQAQIVLPDDLGWLAKQAFQHELAHHLISSCLPSAPLWLHEGLASFLETARVKAGKVTIGMPPYVIVDRAVAPRSGRYEGVHILVMPLRQLPPIANLVARPPEEGLLTHDALRTQAKYAAAWVLVHFLELGAPDLQPHFQAYLRALQEPDADPRALFESTFAGIRLQENLNAYIRADRWPNVTYDTGAPRTGQVRIRTMDDGEGHLHMAWMWFGGPGETDRQRSREHLAAARGLPSSRVAAHLLAAMLQAMAGNFDAAESEIADGLRIAPDDAGLLEARIHLLVRRSALRADVLPAVEKLRSRARTADQFCTLAHLELDRGDERAAALFAARGVGMNPNARFCRSFIERRRKAAKK